MRRYLLQAAYRRLSGAAHGAAYDYGELSVPAVPNFLAEREKAQPHVAELGADGRGGVSVLPLARDARVVGAAAHVHGGEPGHEGASRLHREEGARVIFSSMDQERKGYISQDDDFLGWLSRRRPDSSALFGRRPFEYIDAILQFRSVDPEYNGVIDAHHLGTLCFGHRYAQTPEQAVQYLQLCDERHTGYVSLQQFLQTLKFIKTGRDGYAAAPLAAVATTAAASSSRSGPGSTQAMAVPLSPSSSADRTASLARTSPPRGR
ncbi:hypothetical protein, conserved [Leishmania lindenbergi]|uniref:EF-hand domain-containing protein n=1 Tax=Leishmania lindenbergi TaxID=651832 RepID=A0AAW3AY42_9TRYP